MWIVMTKSAKVGGIKHLYRRVAVVQIDGEHATEKREPKMISLRAKGVLAIYDLGHYHVGTTKRGAWQQAMVRATQLAEHLNNGGA